MIAIAPGALADIDVGPKSGFTASCAASRWASVHRRGVELPVSDRRERRRPGADGGQRGGAQALGPDAALRRALRGGLREAGLPEGPFQALHLGHADTERVIRARASITSRSPARSRAATRYSARPRTGSSAPASSSAARIRPTSVRTPTCARDREPRRRRVLQLRAIVLRQQAHLRARAVYDKFVDGCVALTRKYVLGDPSIPGPRSVRSCGPRPPTGCASDRRVGRQGRAA